MGFSGTVDGRNPASPNGWLKHVETLEIMGSKPPFSTGVGFRQPSTVSNRVSNGGFLREKQRTISGGHQTWKITGKSMGKSPIYKWACKWEHHL